MTPRTSSRAAILVTVSMALIGLISPVSAYPKGKTIHVTEGQSIQAAIMSAKGGDKIVVEKGTYQEQLTITCDGISLVGHDATIVPPESPVTNACTDLAGEIGSGKQAGICVAGSDIVINSTFNGEHHKVISVGHYVKDVSVEGFSVQGFTGINIAVVGAQDASIRHNTMGDGPQYGALTVGSKNTHMNHNNVNLGAGLSSSHFIGICMDDTSTVTITHNEISAYEIGLCVQTSGAILHNNNVHDCCIGAFVDPGVDGAKLHDNDFSNTPAACGFGYGININGAIKTSVKGNKISGIVGSEAYPGVGILVADDTTVMPGTVPTGDIASGNTVEQNTLEGNDIDIERTSTGTGNVFKKNECKDPSIPADICPIH
jgi:nitrous oxidase accessory protein NosD